MIKHQYDYLIALTQLLIKRGVFKISLPTLTTYPKNSLNDVDLNLAKDLYERFIFEFKQTYEDNPFNAITGGKPVESEFTELTFHINPELKKVYVNYIVHINGSKDRTFIYPIELNMTTRVESKLIRNLLFFEHLTDTYNMDTVTEDYVYSHRAIVKNLESNWQSLKASLEQDHQKAIERIVQSHKPEANYIMDYTYFEMELVFHSQENEGFPLIKIYYNQEPEGMERLYVLEISIMEPAFAFRNNGQVPNNMPFGYILEY